MDDGTYVRRRRWSSEEKRAVVTEALSSGNVIATANRHGNLGAANLPMARAARGRPSSDRPSAAEWSGR